MNAHEFDPEILPRVGRLPGRAGSTYFGLWQFVDKDGHVTAQESELLAAAGPGRRRPTFRRHFKTIAESELIDIEQADPDGVYRFHLAGVGLVEV